MPSPTKERNTVLRTVVDAELYNKRRATVEAVRDASSEAVLRTFVDAEMEFSRTPSASTKQRAIFGAVSGAVSDASLGTFVDAEP